MSFGKKVGCRSCEKAETDPGSPAGEGRGRNLECRVQGFELTLSPEAAKMGARKLTAPTAPRKESASTKLMVRIPLATWPPREVERACRALLVKWVVVDAPRPSSACVSKGH